MPWIDLGLVSFETEPKKRAPLPIPAHWRMCRRCGQRYEPGNGCRACHRVYSREWKREKRRAGA